MLLLHPDNSKTFGKQGDTDLTNGKGKLFCNTAIDRLLRDFDDSQRILATKSNPTIIFCNAL